MYQNSHLSKNPSAKWRNSPVRRRGLLLAVVMALLVVSLILPQPAGAMPSQAWVSAEIRVYSGGDITLCKGEKRTVVVELKVFTARLFGFIGGASSSFPGQTIGTNSSNTQVATISPGFGTTTIRVPNPNGFVPSATQFDIKGVDAGSSLLTFTDDSSAFALSSPVRPRADPRRITVTVKECVFEITAVSKWQLPDGFQPKLKSQFSWTVKPDENGKFDEQDVLTRNSAQLGLTFMEDDPLFTHEISAFASTVQITGQVDWEAGTLEILLKYDPVEGMTFIDCKACEPLEPVPVEAGSSGQGTPYTEYFFPLCTDSCSITKPHELQYFDSRGNPAVTTGTITLTVVRKYR